jgi:hypothetical protein
MKEITVYDPPMCCSTGVCGAAPNPELVRVASSLNLLVKRGVTVKRYNLSQQVGAFAQQNEVRKLLAEKGTGILPIVIIDGAVHLVGRYPTAAEFQTWFTEIEGGND